MLELAVSTASNVSVPAAFCTLNPADELDLVVTSPFWPMTNRVRPEEEAAKRSPRPELSMIREAWAVLPEREATGVVPAKAAEPKTWNLAEAEEIPPIRRSSVVCFWKIVPFNSLKKLLEGRVPGATQ